MNTKENTATNNIQAELNRLWESQPQRVKIKASLFNLIVYSYEPCRTKYFKKMVQMVMEQFPCRIIFIQEDPTAPSPFLRVNVSVSLPESGKGIACDQINIEASGEEMKRVPFLILPHLIPDLPIYLLWGRDPTKATAIVPYLQPFATRVIFDSETTDNLKSFSESILKEMETASYEIVDMNWVRTAGWRQIIAQAFDSKVRVDLLVKASFIRLVYNDLSDPSFSRPATQAIYMQAWFASCLGWTFERLEKQQDKVVLHYTNHFGPIQIHLVAQTRNDLSPEEIIECEIADPNNFDCLFLRKMGNEVLVKASNQYQCQLPFTLLLPTLQSGRSFMQEIFYQKISTQYPHVLKIMGQIDWIGI
ncbi:MAG: glucose-6-phosphate dehydrogenase assembly protein OpcA [Chlamydiales bacterium]